MCILNPEQTGKDPKLPIHGFLFINPAENNQAIKTFKTYNPRRAFLFHSQLYYTDSLFIAGPAIGAPFAAMTLEKLIACGAQRIIVVGWCGSLLPSIHAAQIILADEALSEEGTSEHYPLPFTPTTNRQLLAKLEHFCQNHAFTSHTGRLWTTDAPYRETRGKVENYSNRGIMGVEMEYSALLTVASFRHIDLAGIFLVSDELSGSNWKPSFHNKNFKKISRKLTENLLSTPPF